LALNLKKELTPLDKLGELKKNIKARDPAPVHLWNPPFCGDMDILIARDGSWFHNGRLIHRNNMVQLFSTILRLEDDGNYYLVSPVEKLRIQVEDCPFVVNQMDIEIKNEEKVVVFTTNVNEVIEIGEGSSINIGNTSVDGEPRPVVHIRDGLKALINRSVFYRLVEITEFVSGELGIWSKGSFITFNKS